MIFLPINDTEINRYGGPPLMTLTLVALNVLVMVVKTFMPDVAQFYALFGSVPQFVINGQGGGALTSITSTFIHANLLHLGGNMVFLWVFGRRIEDACGAWRYLVFYLACGLSADLISTMIRFEENIPGIGASGAVAGLLGAYMLLFPGGRIRTFLLLIIFPAFPRVRAFWFLLYWFAIQAVSAYQVYISDLPYSVNYWAHLGGFLAGIFVFFFLRPEAFSRYLSNEAV